MRKSEIEAWALSIIDRVVKGQPTEDDRVELKAEWIDPKKAARRIAGHANASHGEIALWLIGVDEAGAVPGVQVDDFADWHQAVRACFDELAPEIERLNVPYGGVTIAALLIETDRAPFVVKCQEGGGVAREVPYRHGTRCDAATRGQLVRLLAPSRAMPKFELVGGSLQIVRAAKDGIADSIFDFKVTLTGYLIQSIEQQTILARHRASVAVTIAGETYSLRHLSFRPLNAIQFYPPNTTATLTGISEIEITASGSIDKPKGMPLPNEQELQVTLAFDIHGFDRKLTRSILFDLSSRDEWRVQFEAHYQKNLTA